MLAILWAAAEEGAVRWNEFKQALEGIPPRTLAQRLSELEEAGVLERRVLPDSRPPRVEYRLTPAGRRLGALVDAMRAYAAAP
jgi:DNA-binding HxlR family transcriptional regulator